MNCRSCTMLPLKPRRRQLLEAPPGIGRAQVNPPHHSANELIGFGHFEQPACFFNAVPRLHRNGSIEPDSLQQRLQIAGEKIALQRRHGVRDPGVILSVVVPEMLVCVDSHFGPWFVVRGSWPQSLSFPCREAPRNFDCPGARNYIAPMLSRCLCAAAAAAACLAGSTALAQSALPPITLDEYFNSTSINSAALSPDGSTAVIATEAPD